MNINEMTPGQRLDLVFSYAQDEGLLTNPEMIAITAGLATIATLDLGRVPAIDPSSLIAVQESARSMIPSWEKNKSEILSRLSEFLDGHL